MDKVLVRYCSKLGNTRKIAEAIAAGAGVTAVSITDEPEIKEHADLLFLGGATYANIMAPELRAYAERLEPDMVGSVVLFTTSNWSRRTVRALRKIMKAKGIPIAGEYFYAHMTRIKARSSAAMAFASRMTGK